MTRKASFSSLEQTYKTIFRDKVDKSDDATDLEKQFTHFIGKFIKDALNDRIDVLDNDIAYDPNAPTHYSLSPKLRESEAFMEAFDNSDLPNILERFARTTHKAMEHYRKLEVEDEIKLRGAPGSQYRTKSGKRIAVRPGSKHR